MENTQIIDFIREWGANIPTLLILIFFWAKSQGVRALNEAIGKGMADAVAQLTTSLTKQTETLSKIADRLESLDKDIRSIRGELAQFGQPPDGQTEKRKRPVRRRSAAIHIVPPTAPKE